MAEVGKFSLVVGPLGSGKQALIDAILQQRPAIRRSPLVFSGDGAGARGMVGGISAQAFRDAKTRHDFIASWDADGVRYGLPQSVGRLLEDGAHVLLSASYFAIDAVRVAIPQTRVLHVTARSDILCKRIRATGLYTEKEIEQHLADAARFRPLDTSAVTVDTSDSISGAVEPILSALDAP